MNEAISTSKFIKIKEITSTSKFIKMKESISTRKFIKVLLQVSVFVLFFSIFNLKINAEEGLSGNCKWTLDDMGTLSIDKRSDVEYATDKPELGKSIITSNETRSKVRKIIFLCEVKANPDASSLFFGLENLEEIVDLDLLDTSEVTKMDSMFMNCKSLTKFDISKFDTSQV
ncbi:MAG: DUF285 domain-containing protein, partial [Clostridioides sp.]|nr:DUF285 domain-containing protein [Clostridioides sp.]